MNYDKRHYANSKKRKKAFDIMGGISFKTNLFVEICSFV